jgi:hypothetical protein
MKKHVVALLSLFAVTASVPALEYNQTITAIFGGGNPDGGWTTGTGGGIELGLRAKNRDDGSTPNVDGVYSFPTGYAVGNPARALWNFEFSIDTGAQSLSSYDFYLGIDTDAGAGVNYLVSLVDPLSAFGGNSFGKWNTLNGQGVEISLTDALSDGYTIAQNSQNIAFYGQNPEAPGIYDYRLFAVAKDVNNSPLASSGGHIIAQNSSPVADVNIQVRVGDPASVPDAGSTFAFLAFAGAGLAAVRRRIAA